MVAGESKPPTLLRGQLDARAVNTWHVIEIDEDNDLARHFLAAQQLLNSGWELGHGNGG